jgi:hypothetical protein
MRISSRVKNKIKFNSDHINYKNSKEELVPSVTTILKVLAKDDALMIWANNLGWKRKSYKNELDKSSIIGTTAHAFCEYMMTKDEELLSQIKTRMETFSEDIFVPTMNAIDSFKKWYTKNNHRLEVIESELSMTCDDFGGTTDLVCKFDGILMLMDFKTSSSFYMSQFLQLAAYSIMYEEKYGKKIKDVAVLRLDKKNGREAELLRLTSLPKGNLKYYKHIFKILVKLYKYHNVLNNDWNEYNSLIKSGTLFG